jgi:protein-tyrosine phosphatase
VGPDGLSGNAKNERVRIAMICLGNICRSPMAAAVAAELVARSGLANLVVLESFGTAGYHEGEPMNAGARAALKRHGWPSDGHRARRITPVDVRSADLLLVADHSNLFDVRRLTDRRDRAKIRLLRSFDPRSTPAELDVPDPWGGSEADFDHALDLIEAACVGLVEHLATALF